MKKIKKFRFLSHQNTTGELIPLYLNKTFPIKTKRIFFLLGKKNKIRGKHAHKTCSQLFIPILGTTILKIKTQKNEKTIKLSSLVKVGILVPPKFWCEVKFTSKKTILMVACDKIYNSKDYIKNYKDYVRYINKK